MTDVCLILEGTYPYVAGGVSSWVYELIRRMPDITFSILYLGPHRPQVKKMHYKMPNNIVEFREFYLFDYLVQSEKKKRKGKDDFQLIGDFLVCLKNNDTALFKDLVRLVGDKETRTIDLMDLSYSYDAWKVLCRLYEHEGHEASFMDYFWTWRFIYLPFFSLLRAPLLSARLYHTVSTGYAGVLGSLCKLQQNRPLLLTEHGIYTRERKIEVSQADWIYSESAKEIKVVEDKDFFKDWWLSLFAFFSKLTYDTSDEIITLFEGNRQIQLEDGADPLKTSVIPNGIDVGHLMSLKKEPRDGNFRVGFMGRVVPIKDVKTFIRACQMVHEDMGNVEFFIMGPTDEDEDYYDECVQLTKMEKLQDVVHFTGKVRISEYYPKMDVIVLTSISEAQPLVLLEAMACGIPVVATDVGACSELLFGRTADDKLLGQSGIITELCNPYETAKAIIDILKDPRMFEKMSQIGRKRILTYYQLDDVIAKYRLHYYDYMEEICWV